MIHAMCIGKAKDEKSNNISKYKLRDFNNVVSVIEASALKKAIVDGDIVVANLTLTHDNRLVEHKLDSLSDLKLSSNQYMVLGTCPPQSSMSGASTDTSSNTNPKNSNQSIKNVCKAQGLIFYIDNENYLCVRNDTTGESKRIDQRVHSACPAMQGDTLNLFYTSIESSCAYLMHIIYDLGENKVLKRGIIQKLSDRNIVLGKGANPTLIKDNYSEKYADRPAVYTYDGYPRNGFMFIPVKIQIDNGYKVIGLIIYDMGAKKAYGAAYPQMGETSSFYRVIQSINNLTTTGIYLTIMSDDSNYTVLKYQGYYISLEKSTNLISVGR